MSLYICQNPSMYTKNLRGNHGLGPIVMCQWRFTDGNEGTTVLGMPMVEEAVHLRDRAYVGALCACRSNLL